MKKLLPKIGLGVLIVVGCLAVFWAYGVGWTAETEPLDSTRGLTADAVAQYYGDPTLAEGESTLVRTHYIDRSYDIEFEFDNDEIGIYSLYTVERKTSDALTVYGSTALSTSLMEADEVTLEERPDLFSWGDNSSSQIMMFEGQPAGHVIVARKGKVVFTVSVSGVFIDNPEELEELLSGLLASAERDG